MAVGVAYVMEQCTSRASLEVSEKKRREEGHNIQSSADHSPLKSNLPPELKNCHL